MLPAFRTTTQCSCCVNFVVCTVIFLYFRARHSASFLSSLEALTVSPPFGTLSLDSCPLAGVRSSHLFWRYFRSAVFDGDDSSSILCGFLTAADISCSLAFWILLWVSVLSSWIFDCGVSHLFHINLEIRSLLICTTLHFILLWRLWTEFLREFDCENGWDPYW